MDNSCTQQLIRAIEFNTDDSLVNIACGLRQIKIVQRSEFRVQSFDRHVFSGSLAFVAKSSRTAPKKTLNEKAK